MTDEKEDASLIGTWIILIGNIGLECEKKDGIRSVFIGL